MLTKAATSASGPEKVDDCAQTFSLLWSAEREWVVACAVG